MRLCRVRLGELRLGEEFRTCLQDLPGRVMDTGYVRPHYQHTDNRPYLECIEVTLAARRMLLSPELWVLVPPERPHLRTTDIWPGRYTDPLPEDETGHEENRCA